MKQAADACCFGVPLLDLPAPTGRMCGRVLVRVTPEVRAEWARKDDEYRKSRIAARVKLLRQFPYLNTSSKGS